MEQIGLWSEYRNEFTSYMMVYKLRALREQLLNRIIIKLKR
jgi:hypothetical protein